MWQVCVVVHQVADDYDIIVNCSGVGARHLANDVELEPLKGQLIKASIG